MNRHSIIWTEPAPFWTEITTGASGATAPEFRRPSILRFTTDSFMDELLDVLATDPRRLGEYRVRPETWRGLAPSPIPLSPKKIFALPFQRLGAIRKNGHGSLPTKPPQNLAPDLPPLKLYAPAAQRYYVIASCLVCQVPGLPDRHVEAGRGERVAFLVRRLFPPGTDATRPKSEWKEHAWVKGPSGNFWLRLGAGEIGKPAEGEERLPMFGLNFTADDLRQRRLFAGLVPVGKREAYLGGALGTNGPPSAGTVKTARKILFRKEIAEPWKALITRAANLVNQTADDTDVPSGGLAKRVAVERAQIQTVSWLILLDFARFLRQYLPGVHSVINGQAPPQPLTSDQQNLVNALNNISVGATLKAQLKSGSNIQNVPGSMKEALSKIEAFQSVLENKTTEYLRDQGTNPDWPDFLFPLADPSFAAQAPLPPASLAPPVTTDEKSDLIETPQPVDNLAVLVVRALPASAPQSEPAIPSSSIAPANALEGWFVLRCAYERPACGPLHEDVVSPPTEPFLLAGFFDPDAPARPIRIGLPLDISPAGLRKFDRNTAFVMSDMLCGQLKRFQGVTFGDLVRSVLPFPLHKDLPAGGAPCATGAVSFGTICSLSIPIITICALILLIIIVTLLDLVFHWLPFFILCFPIPGLKGKNP
jgi:hypothetical protein